MNMRASGASELRQFSHFHILKLSFPSIFCRYLIYFVSESYILRYQYYICIIIYNQCSSLLLLVVWRYKQQYIDKTLTLRDYMCERAERAFSHSKTIISFNILSVVKILYLRIIYFKV